MKKNELNLDLNMTNKSINRADEIAIVKYLMNNDSYMSEMFYYHEIDGNQMEQNIKNDWSPLMGSRVLQNFNEIKKELEDSKKTIVNLENIIDIKDSNNSRDTNVINELHAENKKLKNELLIYKLKENIETMLNNGFNVEDPAIMILKEKLAELIHKGF